mgnify:FL=1
MAGVAPGHSLALGPVGLLVQDGGLLPERALGTRGAHRGRQFGPERNHIRRVRGYRRLLGGRPCRHGSYLQLDGVKRARRLVGARVVEVHSPLLGPTPNGRFGAEGLGERSPELRDKGVGQEGVRALDAVGLEPLLRRVAARLPRFVLAVAQESPIEYEVDVLREALNEPESLRQARTALEHHGLGEAASVKKVVQGVAHPEVLLDDGRRKRHPLRGGLEDQPALASRGPSDPVHASPPISSSRRRQPRR